MRDLPSGTLTLLFTDIEGSTRLLHALGDRYPVVLEAHRALLRAACAAHEGVEVDTQGDASFVVFPHATKAVAAAIAAQRSLAAHAWPDGLAVRVRMGLHTGEPQRTAEGYAGLDVHRAARVAHAGHGGQVLLTAATAVHAQQSLVAGVTLRDLGLHRLKDLVHPERLYQLDIAGLDADFPPVRSLDSHPNNLPLPATPIIGRAPEVERLTALLRRGDVRLVTLTGPGGTGKTRLALRVAADLLHDFGDGVFFIDLVPLAVPSLVVPTIARTLGVRETDGRSADEQLVSFLRDRHLLLILDNFEHVLAAGTDVARLLASCPRLTVLATSRAPLRLTGEHEYPVPPLPLPDPGHAEPTAQVSQYAAVTLFVERAAAVRPDFAVTLANVAAIAQICIQLDGLPLAIELAAARIRLLSPAALLGRLDQRLTLLTGGPRDIPVRQQTLRATIAWSHDLLTSTEQVLFRRLAVFAGGWTLGAAAAVCDPHGDLGVDVLEGLTSLSEKQLVKPITDAGSEPRFGMLETIHEFGWEQLTTSGEQATVQFHHLAYHRDLAEQYETGIQGPGHLAWLDQMKTELPNVRAALTFARDHDALEAGLRLFAALTFFWRVYGHVREGQAWGATFLAAPDMPPAARGKALFTLATTAFHERRFADAKALFAESIAMFGAAGEVAYQGHMLTYLAVTEWQMGDSTTARAHAHMGVALCRQAGHAWHLAWAVYYYGWLMLRVGETATGRAAMEESVTVFRETGDTATTAYALFQLGILALDAHDFAAASTLYADAVARFYQLGDPLWQAMCHRWLAVLAACQGATAQAAGSLQTARELYAQVGRSVAEGLDILGMIRVFVACGRAVAATLLLGAAAADGAAGAQFPAQSTRYLQQALDLVRAALDEDTFAVAWAEGQTLSLDQAFTRAVIGTSVAGGAPSVARPALPKASEIGLVGRG